MADSWPYPLAQEIWDRLDNTFSTEEDYEDLRIQDFVVSGRLMARRRLDRLTMPWGQSLVLEQGTISLGLNKVWDTSIDTALGYTSVVGTMLAEELALGARCPGNQWEHPGYIAGSGSFFPQCIHQSHLGYIWNVTSTCVQHVLTSNIQCGCHWCSKNVPAICPVGILCEHATCFENIEST